MKRTRPSIGALRAALVCDGATDDELQLVTTAAITMRLRMEVLTRARDYRIPFSVRVTSDEWSRWPPCNIGALGGVVAGLQKHANATGPDCKQVNVISGTARCCLSWPTISSGLPRWPISLHI